MKKIFLLVLIAFIAVGSVFALKGKILAGGTFGYLPQKKMAQFNGSARYQMDFKVDSEISTDVVFEGGFLTDFKKDHAIDVYLGAGLTMKIADGWNVFLNCGLDMLLNDNASDLGVAAIGGCEYEVLENISINANFKVIEYFKNHEVLYKPGIGIKYAI